MKILHIVTQMEAGGAQGAAIRLHLRMLESGYESRLVFLYRKRGVYDNVPFVYSLLQNNPSGFLGYFYILKELYKFIKINKSEVVYCYTHYSNIIGSVVARFARVKNIIISHRSLKDCYPNVVAVFDKILGITGFYDKIICVSNSVAAEFQKYPKKYKDKIIVIHNGVEVPDISKTNKYDWIRNPAYLNLVTAGRLHEQKNHNILFKAVLDNPKLRLIIAGEGHLRQSYESFILENSLSERIILIGEIPPTEVMEFVSKGDIFVFPSKTEAFGFSLVEAMSIGMPVVASDISAFREIGQNKLSLLDAHDSVVWSLYFKNFDRLNELEPMSFLSKELSQEFTFDLMFCNYIALAEV